MRIPWYIVTLLIVSIIALGAWLAIRDADFTRAPSPEALEASVAEWQERYPPLPEKPAVVTRKLVDIPSVDTPVVEEPAPPQIPIGNLGFSPALNQFAEHASYGAASFIQLAESLEKTPQLQDFATLAWERAIDTGKPNQSELQRAESALRERRQNQAAWWADTQSSLLIDIHISIPEESIDQKAELTTQMLQAVRDGSGYLVIPNIVWRHQDPSYQVWLKAPSDSGSISHKIKLNDAVLVQPANNETAQAATTPSPISHEELFTAVFDSITSTLRFSASPEPPQPSTLSPQDSLYTALTRLHWQAFAHLLHGIKLKAPEQSSGEQGI